MNDRGFILISTLMILALAGVMASQLTRASHNLLLLFQERSHQQHAYQRALLSRKANSERFSDNLSHIHQTGRAGKIEKKISILTFEPTLSPLINYNEIFSTITPCLNEAYDEDTSFTDTGRPLSNGSYRSSRTCIFLEPLMLSDDLIIDGNLETLNNITLDDTKDEYLIAATGYINIPKTITTTRPLTIIAGGDIFVGEVGALETQKFSYLSSSGVTISKTSQNILVTGYAREGSYISSVMPLKPFQSPLKRKKLVMSLLPSM